MRLKVMMALLPLFCVILLTGCRTAAQVDPDVYSYRPWPETPEKIEKQSQVAEYIVEGKSAYDSCTAAVDINKALMSYQK